jgi:hypothetical protein
MSALALRFELINAWRRRIVTLPSIGASTAAKNHRALRSARSRWASHVSQAADSRRVEGKNNVNCSLM